MAGTIGHTGMHRGKRVRVHLKHGKPFDDVFEERTDRHVFLKNHGKVLKKDIRTLTILKEQ